jgi:hypothetical protein
MPNVLVFWGGWVNQKRQLEFLATLTCSFGGWVLLTFEVDGLCG